MAKTERKSVATKIKTVKGELVGFNSIQKPSVKFDKGGAYQAHILISKEDGEQLAKEIKKISSEQYKTHGKGTKVVESESCKPYVETETNEDGEVVKETPDAEGRYIFKTKAKAFIEDGKAGYKIPVFDTQNKAAGDVKIGNGSTVKLAFTLEGYSVASKTGVSVKLKAVQIIDLVEYGVQSAEAYGFGEEEGFTADDVKETEEAKTTDDNDEEEDF